MMVTTTKEQREAVARQIADHPRTHKTGCFFLADVAALLSDAKCLAAIEAVTPDEVRDRMELDLATQLEYAIVDGRLDPDNFVKDNRAVLRKIVRDAVPSLSAEIAEQTAEISRLHRLAVCAPEGAPPPVVRPYAGPTAEQLETMPSVFDRREPPVPVELVGG